MASSSGRSSAYEGVKHVPTAPGSQLTDDPHTNREPIGSGKLPAGIGLPTCRSVHVRNIHPGLTVSHLREVFLSAGAIERCQLMRQDKSSFGFVDYYDPASASLAVKTLNESQIWGQPIKVDPAHPTAQNEDASAHHKIFVGHLCDEVSDDTLFACFSAYSCSDAKVMCGKSGRSRGFGFVSFRNHHDAQRAIIDMNVKWLGING